MTGYNYSDVDAFLALRSRPHPAEVVVCRAEKKLENELFGAHKLSSSKALKFLDGYYQFYQSHFTKWPILNDNFGHPLKVDQHSWLALGFSFV